MDSNIIDTPSPQKWHTEKISKRYTLLVLTRTIQQVELSKNPSEGSKDYSASLVV